MSLYPFTLKLNFTPHVKIAYVQPYPLPQGETDVYSCHNLSLFPCLIQYLSHNVFVSKTNQCEFHSQHWYSHLKWHRHYQPRCSAVLRNFFYNSSCSHQKTVRLEQLAYRIGKQMVKILDGIENRTLLDFCFFLWFILQGGHTMDRPVKLVSPSWIWKCIKKGHLVPENKFAL